MSLCPIFPVSASQKPCPQKGGAFGFGDLLHRLMTTVLGYERYGAHGGDWGSSVCDHLARSHRGAVVGIHITDEPFWYTFQPAKNPSPAEQRYLKKIQEFQQQAGAYAMIQGTRPQTAAPGLNDSPAGLAAWIVEKFQEWSDCQGDIEQCFSKDELLTHVMIYWLTETIGSSFQPYRDYMKAGAGLMDDRRRQGLDWLGQDADWSGPLLPADIATPPREWAERFYEVKRWTEMPRGGHFAALEEPDLLAEDIRAFFRPLRVVAEQTKDSAPTRLLSSSNQNPQKSRACEEVVHRRPRDRGRDSAPECESRAIVVFIQEITLRISSGALF